jgi:DNA-binding transcriptional ArsR family regulator
MPMLDGVIGSKTKINILVKLFLNPAMKAYLRELSTEFDVSSNSVRTELNTLAKHKLLIAERDGRSVYYKANPDHPLFPELTSMVRKLTGVDEMVNSILERLGNLEAAYLAGDYARGIDSGIIDLILIGRVNRTHLEDIVGKTERYIGRKIRPLVLSAAEFDELSRKGTVKPVMRLWERKG